MHPGRRIVVAVPLLAALACGGGPEPGTVQATPTVEELANATFDGILDEPVRLSDGRWEGPPWVEGGASRPVVLLLLDRVAIADLDGDGADEAVVVLVEQPGGSGSFVHLAVVERGPGGFEALDSVRLGDRVQVDAVGATPDGAVRVELLEHGPDDAACCPTQRAVREWSLRDGALVPGRPA